MSAIDVRPHAPADRAAFPNAALTPEAIAEGARADIVTDRDNHAAVALYRALGAEERDKIFLRYAAPMASAAEPA
ncbi:MAG: hypothetical protein ACFBWO_01265 [Paracoccaceae bacterium]